MRLIKQEVFLLLTYLSGYDIGKVYWYRFKREIYGFIILDYQAEAESYLVAISDKIADRMPPTIEQVLDETVYTLAWFDLLSMKSPLHVHYLGDVCIKGRYTDRAGLLYGTDGSVIIKNCGGKHTWQHSFRSYGLKDTLMREVLVSDKIPKTR